VPRPKKQEAFQPSRETSRIIPCEAGYAYISDQFGKTRHLKRDSEEFIQACISADEFFDGKITSELMSLNWTTVLERMKVR